MVEREKGNSKSKESNGKSKGKGKLNSVENWQEGLSETGAQGDEHAVESDRRSEWIEFTTMDECQRSDCSGNQKDQLVEVRRTASKQNTSSKINWVKSR